MAKKVTKKVQEKEAPKGPSAEERLAEVEGDMSRLCLALNDMFGGTLGELALEIAKKRQGSA